MVDQLVTEIEARRMMFKKDSRPSMASWQRMRRELALPHLRLNRKVYYRLDELETHLDKMHKPRLGD